jgi:alanine dehydrogenase
MDIGILGPPSGLVEGRVLVTPRQAGVLDAAGVRVTVQHGAGEAAGFADADYAAEGAFVVARRDQVLAASDVVLAVARPSPEDAQSLRPGAILMGFYHAGDDAPFVEAAAAREATVVTLERAETDDGRHPFRERMAEIAGVVSAQLVSELLLRSRGVLLGGVTGVPPADVVVIGAGYLGRSATRALAGAGASILVLDRSLNALEAIESEGLRRVTTMLAGPSEVKDAASWADVVIGAIRVPDGSPPKLISALSGRPGAVWVDLSIDEGGCFEESRPIYRADDAYSIDGVLCCPVPNLASWAARTASRIGSALLAPVLLRAADRGKLDLGHEPWLLRGTIR